MASFAQTLFDADEVLQQAESWQQNVLTHIQKIAEETHDNDFLLSSAKEAEQRVCDLRLSFEKKVAMASILAAHFQYRQVLNESGRFVEVVATDEISTELILSGDIEGWRFSLGLNTIMPEGFAPIQASLRICPLSLDQAQSEEDYLLKLGKEPTVTYMSQANERKRIPFIFSSVFDDSSISKTDAELCEQGQESVFQGICTDQVFNKILEGRNFCFFAYGQTGSGKTHLIRGKPGALGLLPRFISRLFELLLFKGNVDCVVKLRVCSLYNENLTDEFFHVFGNMRQTQRLPVRESQHSNGPYIDGIIELTIQSYEEAMFLLEKADRNVMIQQTRMSASTSRMTRIYELLLYNQSSTEQPIAIRVSFVDMNGSERASKQLFNDRGASAQDKKYRRGRLQEASKISLSLSSFAQVVNSLNDVKRTHVPYRDSRLTRLFQDALGGNCYTHFICCVNPLQAHRDETLSSLRYTQRIQAVLNRPRPAVLNCSKENPQLHLVPVGMFSKTTMEQLSHEVEKVNEQEFSQFLLAQFEPTGQIVFHSFSEYNRREIGDPFMSSPRKIPLSVSDIERVHATISASTDIPTINPAMPELLVLVNGMPIHSKTSLCHGDWIRVGKIGYFVLINKDELARGNSISYTLLDLCAMAADAGFPS